jgi:murein peptide amidase A
VAPAPGADHRVRALARHPVSDRLGSELDGWRVEEYGRSRGDLPLRVFLPAGDGPLAGLLTAGQHGEEADTTLLVRRLLERVPGAETRWAVIPVLNPDGLLAGTRQNAAGVDLNRNFPSATWEPDVTFTFPPGIDPELRVLANRTNRSSPGAHAGSEPETQALIALIERLDPPLVVDLHSPLELIFVRGDVPGTLTEGLARSADLPYQDQFVGHCPGAFDDWLTERGTPVLVYEIEHDGLPALSTRHLSGLEAMLRGY